MCDTSSCFVSSTQAIDTWRASPSRRRTMPSEKRTRKVPAATGNTTHGWWGKSTTYHFQENYPNNGHDKIISGHNLVMCQHRSSKVTRTLKSRKVPATKETPRTADGKNDAKNQRNDISFSGTIFRAARVKMRIIVKEILRWTSYKTPNPKCACERVTFSRIPKR